MNKLFYTIAAFLLTVIAITGCKNNDKKMENNPLLQEFTNKYGIPPFDKIKNSDFMPAFQKAMHEQNENIAKIVENKEEPTFANTIEAFEYSNMLYRRVSAIFENLLSSNTNDSLQELAQELATIETKHNADIVFNQNLFDKIKTIYDKRNDLNLNQEQSRLLEETYEYFVRSGAGLSKEKQDSLRDINEQLEKLSLQFGDNNLAEQNNYSLVIDKKEDLSGLPQSMIDAAAEEANKRGFNGKWAFTLKRPIMFAFLQYADNRDLREKLYNAFLNISNKNDKYDNKAIINKMVNFRIQKAHIMGYKNFADYVLEKNMAKNSEKVDSFLNLLMTKDLIVANKEAKDLQDAIKKDGKNFTLEPWDWFYYTEKIRMSKYDINQQELSQYFELNNVLAGLFMVVKKLYNLDIQKLDGVPTYNPEAQPYTVKDATTGNLIGIVYMDFFPRNNKQSGAWMTEYRTQYKQDGKDYRPIISTVFNLTRPSANNPTLLNIDEVETIFHEFGHTIHGLLSQCTYPSLAGTNVPRDFVELPSQVLENWATDPIVLKMYAKHYKTGETIPDELIAKMDKASKFNQGFITGEYLAASILDMAYHTIDNQITIDVTKFEDSVMKAINLPSVIEPRYRSTYFAHIFSGGYYAGYYSYIWAAVLDADVFEAFKETGDVFNPKVAKALRDDILSQGGTDDPMNMFVKFRGRQPKIEPLLKKRGMM